MNKLEEKIKKWLNNTSGCLDISSLGLTMWPKLLKDKENLITKLNCFDNEITVLPMGLSNLTELDCSFNKFKTLPSFPKLTKLSCYNNQLKVIPSFPKLTKLSCYNNQLKVIPSNLTNLVYLNCSGNLLTTLPDFPNLAKLICDYNKLIVFSYNFQNLIYLCCCHNQLKSISGIPKLNYLKCSSNQLESLPDMPKVIYLNCSNNKKLKIPSGSVSNIIHFNYSKDQLVLGGEEQTSGNDNRSHEIFENGVSDLIKKYNAGCLKYFNIKSKIFEVC